MATRLPSWARPAGLATLILATSLAVGTVSPWLVLPYLALMAWLTLAPAAPAPKPEPRPNVAEPTEPAPSTPPSSPAESDAPARRSRKSARSESSSTTATADSAEVLTKPRRGRSGRGRGKSKATAVPDPTRVAWVRVGPNQFVRVEEGERPEDSTPPEGDGSSAEAPISDATRPESTTVSETSTAPQSEAEPPANHPSPSAPAIAEPPPTAPQNAAEPEPPAPQPAPEAASPPEAAHPAAEPEAEPRPAPVPDVSTPWTTGSLVPGSPDAPAATGLLVDPRRLAPPVVGEPATCPDDRPDPAPRPGEAGSPAGFPVQVGPLDDRTGFVTDAWWTASSWSPDPTPGPAADDLREPGQAEVHATATESNDRARDGSSAEPMSPGTIEIGDLPQTGAPEAPAATESAEQAVEDVAEAPAPEFDGETPPVPETSEGPSDSATGAARFVEPPETVASGTPAGPSDPAESPDATAWPLPESVTHSGTPGVPSDPPDDPICTRPARSRSPVSWRRSASPASRLPRRPATRRPSSARGAPRRLVRRGTRRVLRVHRHHDPRAPPVLRRPRPARRPRLLAATGRLRQTRRSPRTRRSDPG